MDALANPCARRGRIYEGNEGNNVRHLAFYTQDVRPPAIANFTAVYEDPDPAVFTETERAPDATTAVDLVTNKSERLSWRVQVEDDDPELVVTLHHRPPSGAVRITNMTVWENGTRWSHVLNRSFRQVGVHILWVSAEDSAGNTATSPRFQLRVKPWDIQTKAESAILVHDTAPNATFPFDEGGFVAYELEISASETGVYPETTTANKRVRVLFPGAARPVTDEPANLEECLGFPPFVSGSRQFCSGSNRFAYTVSAAQSGEHVVEFRIRDAAGDLREIRRVFQVLPPGTTGQTG